MDFVLAGNEEVRGIQKQTSMQKKLNYLPFSLAESPNINILSINKVGINTFEVFFASRAWP